MSTENKTKSVITKVTCNLGTTSEVTFDFPSRITVKGSIKLGCNCPCCDEPLELPVGEYSLQDFT